MAEITTDFVVGRPYQDGTGWRQLGDLLTPDDVKDYPALDSMVSTGFLYPYSPDEGFDFLPPHLFGYTQTLTAARAKIEALNAPLEPLEPWTEPDQVVQSRDLDSAERESHARNAEAAGERAKQFYAVVNETQTGAVQVKPTAAKTDAKAPDAARAGYDSMSKDELAAELSKRGLSTSGNKPDLIDRLVENDAHQQ